MKKFFLMMIAIVALTACNGNKFHIDGTLEGASDTTTLIPVALERPDHLLPDRQP